MSTRGNIAIRENGQYTYIYNHHDSYLDGVGITLYQNYSDVEKVKQLIALGDLSSIGVTIEENSNSYQEHLDKPVNKRGTVSYFRDGNRWGHYFSHEEWEDVKPTVTDDLDEVLGNDFTYIFDVDENCWYVGYYKNHYQLYKLEELLHSKELLEKIYSDYYQASYMNEFYQKCLEA